MSKLRHMQSKPRTELKPMDKLPYVNSPRVSRDELNDPSNKEIEAEVEAYLQTGYYEYDKAKQVLAEQEKMYWADWQASLYDYCDYDDYDLFPDIELDGRLSDYEDDEFYRRFAREEGF
ncbi:MAG: hypothetical protein KGH64_02895 [Candidatus Micrarchaeota archaeon]|nr:hypothetical protein [Candidatus Micrarchaeota archaeon]